MISASLQTSAACRWCERICECRPVRLQTPVLPDTRYLICPVCESEDTATPSVQRSAVWAVVLFDRVMESLSTLLPSFPRLQPKEWSASCQEMRAAIVVVCPEKNNALLYCVTLEEKRSENVGAKPDLLLRRARVVRPVRGGFTKLRLALRGNVWLIKFETLNLPLHSPANSSPATATSV